MVARRTGRAFEEVPQSQAGLGAGTPKANDSSQYKGFLMTLRKRVTEAHVARLVDELTARERDIVLTLDNVRVATATQLERLHFTDGSSYSAARKARRTVARLTSLRVLARLERRVGGERSGSSGYVYALDVAGQRLASACGPAGGIRIRRPWTPGAAFVAHQLAVTELAVRLTERTRAGTVELLDFWAEPLSWRTFTGLGGARTVLKPDAFVRVGLGKHEHLYFVEVDRATQSGPALARKLTVYRRYRQTGREQERWGVFPEVLVLVPDEARKDAVVGVASSQPAEARPLFCVGLFEDGADLIAEGGGR